MGKRTHSHTEIRTNSHTEIRETWESGPFTLECLNNRWRLRIKTGMWGLYTAMALMATLQEILMQTMPSSP